MQNRGPSCQVLRTIAEEESAKFLILIDVIRCQRNSTDFSRQIGCFYSHLARGIYAKVAIGQLSTFGELRNWINEERKSLFIGGPEGYEYIYRNRILGRRESIMYVDYVEYGGDHSWSTPRHHDEGPALTLCGVIPPSLSTVITLSNTGFATRQGLKLLADRWRPYTMVDQTTRSELIDLIRGTCEAADSISLSGTRSPEVVEYLTRHWQYPMYSLDMTPIKVSESELKDQQDAKWLLEFNYDNF